MNNANVLIVGAGPVGLLSAICLTRYGVVCDIVEKRTEISQHSKALSINAASLKVFDQLGLTEKFLKFGQKCENIYAYWHDKKIMHIDYSRLDTKFQYFLALPQPETEKIFNQELESSGVKVQRGLELQDIQTIEDGVNVVLKDSDGNTYEKTYNYIIACDGGRSTLRQNLGLSFVGHDYNMMFKMIDCEMDWAGDSLSTHYFVKESGFIIVIPLSGGKHRIVFKTDKIDEGQAATELSTEHFQELVDKYGPKGITISNITWKTEAPFYNRLIENHRHGNVFFAGDSSHLFSPIGGLGMNTGIQDAFNLSWKLAGVIQGDYSKEILDTYCEERHAMAKILINGTDSTTKLIARLDTDLSGNLKNWLPTMANRNLIASVYPRLFSGLGQQYSALNNSETIMIPYALAKDLHGKVISSYHLVDKYKPVILVFSDSINELTSLKQQHSNSEFIVVMQQYPDSALDIKDRVIIDNGQGFYRAFNARKNTAYYLRPDGFMSLLGDEKTSIQQITSGKVTEFRPKQPSYYAFFDVDGTLLNFTSMLSFLAYCHENYYRNKLYGKLLSHWYTFKRTVIFSKRDRNFLNKLYYKNYKNMLIKRVEELGDEWFSKYVLDESDAFNEKTIRQLKQHQQQGAKIVFVTGAFSACISPISKHFDVDEVLCVKPIMQRGQYTGKIEGIQTIGLGKAEAIQEFLERQGNDSGALNTAYAYGDHMSDIPMLEIVANPCVVKNSDNNLMKHAKKHQWAIV